MCDNSVKSSNIPVERRRDRLGVEPFKQGCKHQSGCNEGFFGSDVLNPNLSYDEAVRKRHKFDDDT